MLTVVPLGGSCVRRPPSSGGRSGVGILLAEAAARHVDVEDTTSFSAFLEVWLKGASQHHTQAGRAVQRYLAAKGMGEVRQRLQSTSAVIVCCTTLVRHLSPSPLSDMSAQTRRGRFIPRVGSLRLSVSAAVLRGAGPSSGLCGLGREAPRLQPEQEYPPVRHAPLVMPAAPRGRLADA